MSAATGPRTARYERGGAPVVCEAAVVLLFTDLHLDPSRLDECERFASSLRALLPRAPGSALIVMGDLFDAYAGPEDWELPAFRALRDEFSALSAAGMRVILLRGNRDVMLEPNHLPDPCGIEVEDSVLCHLPQQAPVLVTHGDAFCLADRRYQFLRRTLRRPGLRRCLLRRGVGLRRWLGARLRGVSRGEVARKPLAHLAVSPEPVLAELSAARASRAVIGHLHQRRRQDLGAGRTLWILPAWDPEASAWDLASVLDGAA